MSPRSRARAEQLFSQPDPGTGAERGTQSLGASLHILQEDRAWALSLSMEKGPGCPNSENFGGEALLHCRSAAFPACTLFCVFVLQAPQCSLLIQTLHNGPKNPWKAEGTQDTIFFPIADPLCTLRTVTAACQDRECPL